MSIPHNEDPHILDLIEDYPSPTGKDDLSREIQALKAALVSPPKELNRSRARIKLADLLTGRNEAGDYEEANELYKEVLSSTLPSDPENAKALLGKAEISLKNADENTINLAINSCRMAFRALRESDFFYGKAKVLLAELLIKKGGESSLKEALAMYEETAKTASAHKYFRMRAAVGRLELITYFFKDVFEQKADDYIMDCERTLVSLEDQRGDDYFFMKGRIILAEALLLRKREPEKAKKILSDMVNNDSAGDDLRARASLDLADGASPELARTLIKGVRRMEGLDPYILRKARSIEDAIPRRTGDS